MKKIKDLVKVLKENNLLINASIKDEEIGSLTYNSKEVEEDSLFFCKGAAFKEAYLDEAIKRGAQAYIAEVDYGKDLSKIIVKDIRKAMALVGSFFYDYPQDKLFTIGITGTKGKSTTVIMLKEILDRHLEKNGRKKAAIISSIKTYDGLDEYESSLTTPEALALLKNLNNAVESGLEYAIIEVSSQALKYDRVEGINFDMAGFLNISEDHISPIEHPDFEDYFSSKLSLIDQASLLVYNKDMDFLERVEERAKDKEKISFSLKNTSDFKGKNIEFIGGVLNFDLVNEEKTSNFNLSLLGDYNVENALAAIAIARRLGVDDNTINESLENLEIKERVNFIYSEDKRVVALVDFAHNRLSFEKSYEMIKNYFPDYRIVSIFGSTGGKAINRRKDLGEVAGLYSDFICLVPDDQNFDDLDEINKEIASYIRPEVAYTSYDDRQKAIEAMMKDPKEKTIFFIAGKGNEASNMEKGKSVKIVPDSEVAEKMIGLYDQKIREEK